MHRGKDSNEKKHPISHPGIRKFTRNQQIQNAGVLQHPVKKKDQNQKGRCPSEIRFSDSRFQQNLISCLTDYLPEFFQRHPVRIKSNVCRSLLITDLRALNAWCLFYHLFYFILAVYAFHTTNVKSFSADIHVFRTSWRES